MTSRLPALAAGAALLGLFMTPEITYGDEGMWLFNNPPREQLKKYLAGFSEFVGDARRAR